MGWHSRTVVYQRNVYISRSVTVVNRGNYGHFDRNAAARNYNRNMAIARPTIATRQLQQVPRITTSTAHNNVRTNNNCRQTRITTMPANRYYNNNRPQQQCASEQYQQASQQLQPAGQYELQHTGRPKLQPVRNSMQASQVQTASSPRPGRDPMPGHRPKLGRNSHPEPSSNSRPQRSQTKGKGTLNK